MKRMIAIRDHELNKKERIINELIEEKMRYEKQLSKKVVVYGGDTEKLKSEINSLKLEKESLLKFSAGGTRNVDL